jgi:hypothetical protein
VRATEIAHRPSFESAGSSPHRTATPLIRVGAPMPTVHQARPVRCASMGRPAAGATPPMLSHLGAPASSVHHDWLSFCRWAICAITSTGPGRLRPDSAVWSNPSTGRAAGLPSYLRLLRIGLTEARVDPDIAGAGPTTSESTPPAHATRATRPAPYLSARRGLMIAGAPGCRRYRRTGGIGGPCARYLRRNRMTVCRECHGSAHVRMLRGRVCSARLAPRCLR